MFKIGCIFPKTRRGFNIKEFAISRLQVIGNFKTALATLGLPSLITDPIVALLSLVRGNIKKQEKVLLGQRRAMRSGQTIPTQPVGGGGVEPGEQGESMLGGQASKGG